MEPIGLSVIVPLYNEEKIEQFYSSLTKALTAISIGYEIILVDDGSNPETAALYDALAQDDSSVKIIRHPGNLGQQEAVLSGFKGSCGERVLVLDGDIRVKAVDIRRFCIKFDQGHDVIFGIRNAGTRPFHRRALSSCLSLLVSFFAGRRIHDIGCGFWLFSRDFFARVVYHRKRTRPNGQPINIMAFFLANRPWELKIESGTIRRRSRYSIFKLLRFSISVLRQLPILRARLGNHLATRDWDKIAQTIEANLDKPHLRYFRNDKHLCYEEFYGLNPHSGKVLDVGCGPGHFVLFCAEKGADIIGTDFSSSMLHLTKKRLQKNGLSGSLLRIDVSKGLPFRERAFDTVVCESVLNHLDEPLKLVQEIWRVLKDEGELILDVSNGWGIGWRLAIILSQLLGDYPKGYINWISPAKAHNLARMSGFQVTKSRGLHLFPPPRITSVGFTPCFLLPSGLEAFLEHRVFKINYFLEKGFLFKYLCFKYIMRCRKKRCRSI